MRMWIAMGMLLAPLLALGDWSNSAPTSGSAPVTGPGVAAWRQHLAASGTNAHGGLIPTNAPDGVTIVYTGGVLRVPAGTFDSAGSAAAVSNWAAGRFSTLTGTVAYLADVAGLSNSVWETLGDYVPKSATNGWEVSPHLPWLTDETLWNAASNTVVYTNTPAYTDTVAKASSAYPSSGGALLGNMFMSNGKYIGVTSTLGQVFMTAGIAPSYAPALSLNGTNATLGGWIQIAPAASGSTAIGNPAVPRSSVSVPVTSAGYHLWMSNGVMIIDGAGLYNVTPQQVGADAAGSAAAVSNAAWSQGWITAGDIPAETDPHAVLSDGSRPMTGNLNMGGYSITNIATNSLTFANGTAISSPSNGTLAVNGAEVYTTANPPPESVGAAVAFEPLTMQTVGGKVGVADWITSMILADWFETRLRFAASSGGWEDGMAYVFDDQNGILTDRSSGYRWASPWYMNVFGGGGTVTAYWKMDDDAATTAVEETISNNDGTAQANTSAMHTNGIVNGALFFDGVNDYIEVATCDAIKPSYITVSYWMCPAVDNGSPASAPALTTRGAGNDSGWFIDASSGQYGEAYIRADGSWRQLNMKTNTDVFAVGTWYHIAMTYDGTTMRYWLNGENLTTLTTTGPIEYEDNPVLNIGGHDQTNPDGTRFNGALDDIRIYSTALGTNEILAIYADGSPSELSMASARSNATITATNVMLDYTASNALWRAMVSVTNSVITTNEIRGYIVDLTAGTTNWCPDITLESTTDLSNKMWGASITNLSLGTNIAAGVWASSNVSVTVKGIGAVYAP